jgi:hypothetical protein
VLQSDARVPEARARLRAGQARRRRHQHPRRVRRDERGAEVQRPRSRVEVAPVQAETGRFQPLRVGGFRVPPARAEQELPPPSAARAGGREQRQGRCFAGPPRRRRRAEVGADAQAAQRDLGRARLRAQPRGGVVDGRDPRVEPPRRFLARGVAGAGVVEAENRQSGRGEHVRQHPPSAPGADGVVAEGRAEHHAAPRRDRLRRRVEPAEAALEDDRHHRRRHVGAGRGHGAAQASGQSAARTGAGQAAASRPCRRNSARATRSRPKPAQPVCATSPFACVMPCVSAKWWTW